MKFANTTPVKRRNHYPGLKPKASPDNTINFSGLSVKPVRDLVAMIKTTAIFLCLVSLYSLKIALNWLSGLAVIGSAFLFLRRRVDCFYDSIAEGLSRNPGSLSRAYLIELSFRNLRVKKTRTLVTIGGMAIGIAFIVFLVSVGYGLQNVVTSRVARLEELSQAEIMPGMSTELALNDAAIGRFSNLPEVESVLPLISVVGRASLNESVTDLAVYGVTTDYLTTSAISPVRGEVFESHEFVRSVGVGQQAKLVDDELEASQVQLSEAQGERIVVGELAGEISFEIEAQSWLRVRSGPGTDEEILGYAKANPSRDQGQLVWGQDYSGAATEHTGVDELGRRVALWLKTDFKLWRETACTADEESREANQLTYDSACEDGQYLPIRDDLGNQMTQTGFAALLNLKKIEINLRERVIQNGGGEVLGVWQLAQAGTNQQLELVDLEEVGIEESAAVNRVDLPADTPKVAVVNRAVLSLLGLAENEAVGSSFELTMVAISDNENQDVERIESAPTSFEIVGVTPEDNTPVVYVPLIELRSLGLDTYSQVKLIVSAPEKLGQTRSTIEAMGYGTVSVVDTVAQIENLFASFRLVLGTIGLVALSVAALGMFNTLTVSLLERTREVGLMKAIGMKENEVKELFLTESMIMGLYGGLIGILLGFGAGKLVSLILSSFAISRGLGFLDVSMIPLRFLLMVIGLSLLVGVVTGYYPARRSRRISALNALRYE